MGEARVLYLDGKHQADDTKAVVQIHREIGALALAVHPEPRRVLVIGLGGGVTAGAARRSTRPRGSTWSSCRRPSSRAPSGSGM